MLKIEARALRANKQKEVGFDSQNYPQYLWIVLRGVWPEKNTKLEIIGEKYIQKVNYS